VAIEYRGFEIQVDFESTSKDMFDVWFHIGGLIKTSVAGLTLLLRTTPGYRRHSGRGGADANSSSVARPSELLTRATCAAFFGLPGGA
jgi:hypothetical protein